MASSSNVAQEALHSESRPSTPIPPNLQCSTPSTPSTAADEEFERNMDPRLAPNKTIQCRLQRIEFVEGDESLKICPPEIIDQLRIYCEKEQTNSLKWAVKRQNSAQAKNFGSPGRVVGFYDAGTGIQLDAARYFYYVAPGEAYQFIVVRSREARCENSFNRGRAAVINSDRSGCQRLRSGSSASRWTIWSTHENDIHSSVCKRIEQMPPVQKQSSGQREKSAEGETEVSGAANGSRITILLTEKTEEHGAQVNALEISATEAPDLAPASNLRGAREQTPSVPGQKAKQLKRSHSPDFLVVNSFPVKRGPKECQTWSSFPSSTLQSGPSLTGPPAKTEDEAYPATFTFAKSAEESRPRRRSLVDCGTAKQFFSNVYVAGLVDKGCGVLRVQINQCEPERIVYNDEQDHQNLIFKVKKLATSEEVHVIVTPVE